MQAKYISEREELKENMRSARSRGEFGQISNAGLPGTTRFRSGDQVLAKWTDSRWYPATVQHTGWNGQTTVVFTEDDIEYTTADVRGQAGIADLSKLRAGDAVFAMWTDGQY